jgi:hypothetical protein
MKRKRRFFLIGAIMFCLVGFYGLAGPNCDICWDSFEMGGGNWTADAVGACYYQSPSNFCTTIWECHSGGSEPFCTVIECYEEQGCYAAWYPPPK